MPRFRVMATLRHEDYPLQTERERFSGLDCVLDSRVVRGEEDTIRYCAGAHIILTPVGGGVFSRNVLDRLRDCLAIIRYGVGLDGIDVKGATELGIIVAHVPDFCTDEVSTHTIMLILACWRKLIPLSNKVREGVWSYRPYKPIYRLSGKTLGLISFGRVARAVAIKAKALGLKVVAYDPYVDPKVMGDLGVKPLPFEELLKVSNIVSVHAPATEETYHMISDRELGMMQPGAILVNTSRGAVVDELALYRALMSGAIAAAGLDVLEVEPPDFSSPLFALENVVVTPHCAFYSEESLHELHSRVAEAAVEVMRGKVPSNTVNVEVMKKARLFHRGGEDG